MSKFKVNQEVMLHSNKGFGCFGFIVEVGGTQSKVNVRDYQFYVNNDQLSLIKKREFIAGRRYRFHDENKVWHGGIHEYLVPDGDIRGHIGQFLHLEGPVDPNYVNKVCRFYYSHMEPLYDKQENIVTSKIEFSIVYVDGIQQNTIKQHIKMIEEALNLKYTGFYDIGFTREYSFTFDGELGDFDMNHLVELSGNFKSVKWYKAN